MIPLSTALVLSVLGCGSNHSPETVRASAGEPAHSAASSAKSKDRRGIVHGPDGGQPVKPQAPEARAETGADGESAPVPAESLRHLVRARHSSDLPDREHLDRYPHAEDGLTWLAMHGETVGERSRALHLLGHYLSPPSTSLLESSAGNPTEAPLLRVGALRGIALWPEESRQPARTLLLQATGDANPLVAVAALEACRGVPGLESDALEIARGHEALSVREAASN